MDNIFKIFPKSGGGKSKTIGADTQLGIYVHSNALKSNVKCIERPAVAASNA